ncbi:uncharacterized protein LOC143154047 isoform X2 [Ptiloglossa arizonensis]|uniref:uncharacterized protein LOC143154047 isoform X2 n=1 Tax=Ptiloglossa arizonensis TaxID=3350558 RepID=UPI003FA0B97A
MAGITEKYSAGFAWKPRHGVPHAGTRLPINKVRHFPRGSRVLSSHSSSSEDGPLPIESMHLICVQPCHDGGGRNVSWKKGNKANTPLWDVRRRPTMTDEYRR